LRHVAGPKRRRHGVVLRYAAGPTGIDERSVRLAMMFAALERRRLLQGCSPVERSAAARERNHHDEGVAARDVLGRDDHTAHEDHGERLEHQTADDADRDRRERRSELAEDAEEDEPEPTPCLPGVFTILSGVSRNARTVRGSRVAATPRPPRGSSTRGPKRFQNVSRRGLRQRTAATPRLQRRRRGAYNVRLVREALAIGRRSASPSSASSAPPCARRPRRRIVDQ